MPYTTGQAIDAFNNYLGITNSDKTIINDTKERGFVLTLPSGKRAVFFIYPLVHKQDNTKNYFDTRDSGANERARTWNYAIENGLKYFCFGINDSVEKYTDYVFSLECEEAKIEELSGTKDGQRNGPGNQIIIPNDYIPSKPFDRIQNRLGVFISAIHKDALMEYIEKYDNRPYMLNNQLVDIAFLDADDYDEAALEAKRYKGGSNVILYGVPGSGKSWTIEHEYCREGSKVERLVFHPDYTNADFIGQILPVVDPIDKQVTYEFTAGPFTTIIHDAYTHPQVEYVLIIEELNRGNAPAIFGEVFQLLDRLLEPKTSDGILYQVGTSEYGVTHKNMAEFIYGDPQHKVRIPSNLSILATMNTSDQNVFTLDTAFQRRWKMRLIENSFENVRPSLANCEILDTEVTWRHFCEIINKQIVGNKAKMASSEDKRLGVYFVHESDLKHNDADEPVNHSSLLAELNELLKAEMINDITDEQRSRLKDIRAALIQNRIFPEKVIKYLWDDAFKFNPGALFDTEENKELDSLEAVIRMFVYENKGKDRFKVFKSTIRELLYES